MSDGYNILGYFMNSRVRFIEIQVGNFSSLLTSNIQPSFRYNNDVEVEFVLMYPHVHVHNVRGLTE